jgi:hypothetical protein
MRWSTHARRRYRVVRASNTKKGRENPTMSHLAGLLRPRTLLALVAAALATSLAFAAVSGATPTVIRAQGDPVPGVDVSLEQNPAASPTPPRRTAPTASSC